MTVREWNVEGLEIIVFRGDGRGYVWVGGKSKGGGDVVLANGRAQMDKVIEVLQKAREHLRG